MPLVNFFGGAQIFVCHSVRLCVLVSVFNEVPGQSGGLNSVDYVLLLPMLLLIIGKLGGSVS